MVDCLSCEVINTGTFNITGRDKMVCALEAIWYVPKVWYNLISIGLLDSEGCQIQVQYRVVTIRQEDRVILKAEKCGEICKLNEENSVQNEVLMTNLKGSSSRGIA